MMFFIFGKRLRALNSEGVTFSAGSQSLEKFWSEASDASNSVALIKDSPSLQNPHVLCHRIMTQTVVEILNIQSI